MSDKQNPDVLTARSNGNLARDFVELIKRHSNGGETDKVIASLNTIISVVGNMMIDIQQPVIALAPTDNPNEKPDWAIVAKIIPFDMVQADLESFSRIMMETKGDAGCDCETCSKVRAEKAELAKTDPLAAFNAATATRQ